MRRRQSPEPEPTPGVPARFLHYDPTDWPRTACHPECAYWDALREWRKAHPELALNEGITNRPRPRFHPERI